MTASEANRGFSRLLRLVAQGERVRVTSHGRTVAIVAPPEEDDDPRRADRMAARAEMRESWKNQPIVVAPWSREELWDEILR